MLNKVILIGRVGLDPELHYTLNGSPVITLRIVTSEMYTDKDGNRQERAEWHRIVAFQHTAETCSQYLHKGSLVYVEGKLQTRKWQDQAGQDRFTTEVRADKVLFLERPKREPREVQEESKPSSSLYRQSYHPQEDINPADFSFEQFSEDDKSFSNLF